jgi:hypothetical protein
VVVAAVAVVLWPIAPSFALLVGGEEASRSRRRRSGKKGKEATAHDKGESDDTKANGLREGSDRRRRGESSLGEGKGRDGKGRAATTTNKRRQTRRRKQGQAINSSCDGRVLSLLAALLSEGGARDATERPREERSEKVTVVSTKQQRTVIDGFY